MCEDLSGISYLDPFLSTSSPSHLLPCLSLPSPPASPSPTPPHPPPPQTTLLCQYVLNVARYDLNYDVRDRVRFLRQLLMVDGSEEAEVCVCAGVYAWRFPIRTVLLHARECWLWTLFLFPLLQEGSALSKYAKKILLSSKPAPVLESPYKGTSRLLHLEHFHLTASTFTCTEPLLYKQWRLLHHTYMCVLHCLKSIFPLPTPSLPLPTPSPPLHSSSLPFYHRS